VVPDCPGSSQTNLKLPCVAQTSPSRTGFTSQELSSEAVRLAGYLPMQNSEKIRPSTVKGPYIKKITLSGTMTPGVQIKLAAEEA